MPNSAIAAISRLVAIGRLMKISEMFIAPLPAPTASAATSAAARAVKPARAAAGLHLRAGLEPQLAFGDDGLAGLQALLDDDVVADALADGDRLLIDACRRP